LLVVATWTGHSAAALRQALRMTFDEFADRLSVSRRGVTKWESRPDAVLAMRTQQLLDVALRNADDETRARFTLLRQDSATGQAAPNPSAAEADRRALPRPTPELLTSLKLGLRHHYTADNLLGPRALLPVITAQVAIIEQFARDADGPLLDELLPTGAAYAEFAGWLCQDSGDVNGATTWYRQALEWAQAGHDDTMTAFVLTRRAVQAVNARLGAYAARLACAAQRDTQPGTLRVRTIAAQTEALGHAVHGHADDTDRSLDVADALISDGAAAPPGDGDPSAGRYCDMRLYLRISRAKCHLELGRANEAIAAFHFVLDTLPGDYHRDRGQYLARLAQAYVLAGYPGEACSQAQESLAIARTTGSSRTINDLRRLTGQLKPWASNPAVAQLTTMLAAT
jgi:tetratricopeptide (TPR) repeat protein